MEGDCENEVNVYASWDVFKLMNQIYQGLPVRIQEYSFTTFAQKIVISSNVNKYAGDTRKIEQIYSIPDKVVMQTIPFGMPENLQRDIIRTQFHPPGDDTIYTIRSLLYRLHTIIRTNNDCKEGMRRRDIVREAALSNLQPFFLNALSENGNAQKTDLIIRIGKHCESLEYIEAVHLIDKYLEFRKKDAGFFDFPSG